MFKPFMKNRFLLHPYVKFTINKIMITQSVNNIISKRRVSLMAAFLKRKFLLKAI